MASLISYLVPCLATSGGCLSGCLVSYLATCWMVACLVSYLAACWMVVCLMVVKWPVASWRLGKLLGWLVDCMIGWFLVGLGLVRFFSAGS